MLVRWLGLAGEGLRFPQIPRLWALTVYKTVNHTSHKADDNTNRNNLGSWAVVNMAEAADTPQMNMEEWANCHISQRAGRYWQPAFRAGQNILARLFLFFCWCCWFF